MAGDEGDLAKYEHYENFFINFLVLRTLEKNIWCKA